MSDHELIDIGLARADIRRAVSLAQAERSQRYAEMPAAARRALLGCTAWLLAGYVGAAILATAVASFVDGAMSWPAALAVGSCGIALAVAGLVRARTIADHAALLARGVRAAPKRGSARLRLAFPGEAGDAMRK
jgi:hypothetical protein